MLFEEVTSKMIRKERLFFPLTLDFKTSHSFDSTGIDVFLFLTFALYYSTKYFLKDSLKE